MSHYEIIIYLFLRHVNAIFENNSLFEISIEMSQNVKYNLVGGINMLKLKELREKKGLLQKDVANYLKIARNTYSQYEIGAREPDIITLISLADYFGVSIDYLVGRTDNPNITNDVIVESADGNITSLDDAGLSPDDLSRITAVIEDVVKKYRSTTDEVHEDEPSVLAAHADGITEEEMQEDIKKIKDYMRRKNDRV